MKVKTVMEQRRRNQSTKERVKLKEKEDEEERDYKVGEGRVGGIGSVSRGQTTTSSRL